MRKTAVLVLLAFAFSFMACDEFFGTSWGNFRSYDQNNIEVDAGNVDDWIDVAVGNPDLANAVAKKIAKGIGKTHGKDRAKLLEGGIRLAVEGSGLGTSILTQAADLLSSMDEDLDEEELLDTLKDMLSNIQDDFNSGHGQEAAEIIAELVSESLEDGTTQPGEAPTFEDDYNPSPGDVAEAILVLVLGVLGEEGKTIDELGDDWSDFEYLADGLNIDYGPPPQIVVDYDSGMNPPCEPSDTALALAAYLNLIAADPEAYADNPFTDAIYNAFFK